IRSTGTTTRRPRSSTRVSRPSLDEPDIAAEISAAISSGVFGLSMTSSRGECWTPILTSTVADASSCCGLPRGQQQRALGIGAGVGGDDLGDRLDAGPGAPVDGRADVVVVAQVGLEDQPERLALGVDEVEVGADRAVDPGAVVGGPR